VTGTIAHFDDEAQAYMVHPHGAVLVRVPIRDIKRTIESAA